MRDYKVLSRDFFVRDTKVVAKDLLGQYLIRKTDKGVIIGKIIEVEAYLGPEDKACHSYDFKKTERTKIMYKKPGTLYIYFIYGMYFCLNVVTEPEGIPCAVLIRQLFPVDGIELMKESRNVKIGKNFKNLLDGPGKLCMAFNITKREFNGLDSCSRNSKLFFAEGKPVNEKNIIKKKRIGIDYAGNDKNLLLRFFLGDDNTDIT